MQEDFGPRCDQAAELVLIKLQSLARSWFVERVSLVLQVFPFQTCQFPGGNPPPKTWKTSIWRLRLVIWLVLKIIALLRKFLRLFPSLIWSRIIVPNQQHFVLFWTSHRSGRVCYVRSTLSRARSDGNIKATKRSTMLKGTGSPKPLPIFFKQIYESNRKRQLTLEPLFSRLQLWFLERV